MSVETVGLRIVKGFIDLIKPIGVGFKVGK
jgi:hypothetical protein